jgi:hypothetical protein
MNWHGQATAIWKFIVRPIAVGGNRGGWNDAYRMRNNCLSGLARAVTDLKKSTSGGRRPDRLIAI